MAISTVAPRLVLVRMAEADDTSDEELVKRAQGGDRTALDRLVRRHQRALFALCLRYVRDADEAADLVQRSFVRAMGKLAELRDAGVFRSWILRIGAHLALNHIRDHARFVADDGNIEAAISDERAPSASDRLEAAESAKALRACRGYAAHEATHDAGAAHLRGSAVPRHRASPWGSAKVRPRSTSTTPCASCAARFRPPMAAALTAGRSNDGRGRNAADLPAGVGTRGGKWG
jgi:hypothetical protein